MFWVCMNTYTHSDSKMKILILKTANRKSQQINDSYRRKVQEQVLI